MDIIEINGQQHPIHFGLRAVNEFAKRTGISFGAVVAGQTSVDGTLDNIVTLAEIGLNEGQKKLGVEHPDVWTEDDVWEVIDDDPTILLKVADIFSSEVKPLIDKLDGVSDPN